MAEPPYRSSASRELERIERPSVWTRVRAAIARSLTCRLGMHAFDRGFPHWNPPTRRHPVLGDVIDCRRGCGAVRVLGYNTYAQPLEGTLVEVREDGSVEVVAPER